MRWPAIPRSHVLIAVGLVVGSVLAAVLTGATSLPQVCAPSSAGTPCAVQNGATYQSEIVEVRAPSTAGTYGVWGAATNISFDGVAFALAQYASSPGLSAWYIQGQAEEPNGLSVAFLIFPNNSSFGGSHAPTNEQVRTFYAPDRTFGAIWMGTSRGLAQVDLQVARPLLAYDSQIVTLNGPSSESIPGTATTRASLDGYGFTFAIVGWGSPAGPGLNITVIEPDGVVAQTGLWAGPLACQPEFGPPSGGDGVVTCLEAATPDHRVAIAWDGMFEVAILVETA